MGKIYKSVTELVGRTPLLEVQNIEEQLQLGATVLVKLEYFNTAGSVKDRVALNMLEEAERQGKIKPGATKMCIRDRDESMFSDEIRKLDALKNKIGAVLKQALGVSVRVKLVEPKTIQRSEGKAVRVIDNRGL